MTLNEAMVGFVGLSRWTIANSEEADYGATRKM